MAKWLDKYENGENELPKAQVGDNTYIKKPPVLTPIGPANNPDIKKYMDIKKDETWGSPYEFMMNWYSNPTTKAKLKSQGFTGNPMTEALNQKLFKDYRDWKHYQEHKNREAAEGIYSDDYENKLRFENELNKTTDLLYENQYQTTAGFHNPSDSTVAINKRWDRDHDQRQKTAVHELTHATPLDNYYTNYFKTKKPKNPKAKEKEYFDKDPEEIYPRIMDLRFQMNLKPGRRVTPDMLEDYYNDSDYDLKNYYSPKELADIMNEIAYNPKTKLSKAQNGIEGTMGGLTDKGFNYNGAWGGPSMQMGGNIQPPMAGADQTVPMYQMGGYVYPTTFVPQAEMGASLPGSVGFTYARTKGIPSEGPYGKKTIPSAQKGKKIDIRRVPKRTDSDAENLFEILDPTGLSSWDDIYRSYKKTGWSPETALEVLGAIPLLGNIAKVTKPGIHLAKYSKVDKALFNTLPRNKSLSSTVSGASKVGRGTDTYQAYDEYQNGGEMQFYQNGLDWTPRNISEYGSEVPMAQPGITEPMRGDIQTRGNKNLLTEIAAQRTKEKKAQEARTRTTIGADKRTAKQKEKDRQAYESKVKYEKEVLGKDFETPQYLQEKNRARAEHLLHLADVGAMGAGLVEGVGKLALKNVPKQNPLGNIFSSSSLKKQSYPDWMLEEMRFASLPELNNPKASEVLENFMTRIKTPEGQKRLKELGITETDVFDRLKIVADENTMGQYWMNKIGLHPELPEVRNVTRHEIEHAVQDAFTRSKTKEASKFRWTDLFGDTKRSDRVYEAMSRGTTDIDEGLKNLELRKTPQDVDWELLKKTRGKQNPYDLFNLMSDKQRATNYFTSGSEGREKSAFLGEVQQYMMDQGILPKTSYAEVTPEMVKNTFVDAMFDENNKGKYLRLFNIMKPTEANYKLIAEGLNKMLGVAPAAIGTTALGAIEQKKKGGVVKDNMGYWNPDNWGKVVEIDSPNITMKGVNQDLIGVSDEGDIQYMTPGNDYTFDGNRVTEYPVAKYGVNQQDEKTVQHLDQLLNFTNKPKAKNGWLDKYK